MDDLFETSARRAEPPVRTVTQLTRLVRLSLESAFADVRVEGEVSNLRIPASGHCYFTLKDENAQIQAVVWKTAMRGLKVKPEEGMALRLTGSVTVFEKAGQYGRPSCATPRATCSAASRRSRPACRRRGSSTPGASGRCPCCRGTSRW
jgi:hypothetical protein